MTFEEVLEIKEQYMILEQNLKIDCQDPKTKLIPISIIIGGNSLTFLNITFMQSLKLGENRENLSFKFGNEGCYLQMFYLDKQNTQTLIEILELRKLMN